MKYKIFKRSCRNWKEFSQARKFHVAWVDSHEEAVRICDEYNSTRTPAQIKRGTKYEFTANH